MDVMSDRLSSLRPCPPSWRDLRLEMEREWKAGDYLEFDHFLGGGDGLESAEVDV